MQFVLALTAVILQLALSTGAPSTHHEYRRSYVAGQRPVTPEVTHQCLNFTHPFCNSAGYSTAQFPNNRDQNFSAAAGEFSHFVLALKSGCSDKLGTLLCFYYFPFCQRTMWQTQPVLPCRETCQEARNNCENVLRENGHNWPIHLDCSKDYFLPASSKKCANGTLAVSTNNGPKEVDPTLTSPSSTTANPIPTATPRTCKVNTHACAMPGIIYNMHVTNQTVFFSHRYRGRSPLPA